MEKIKLYEICDERHIIAVVDDLIICYEILDDLSLKCLQKYDGMPNIIQILKHSKNFYIFLAFDTIIYISLDNDYNLSHETGIQTNYKHNKVINLSNGKIAVDAQYSIILIYNILSNNKIMLQTKIDMKIDYSPISLYYIEKTNELLIRSYQQIYFMNLKKYKFDYIINEYNLYIWGSDYDRIMGNPLENNFCLINEHLLAMSFSKNVITLVDLNTHKKIKNFIDSHDNITSLIKPDNFLDNHFLCSIYSYDCHGGKYYYFANAKLIEFVIIKNDYDNFDVEYYNKITIDKFPVSIRLLRDEIILMLCLNDKKYFPNQFELKIFKYNKYF